MSRVLPGSLQKCITEKRMFEKHVKNLKRGLSQGQVRSVHVRQQVSQKKTRLYYLLKDDKKTRIWSSGQVRSVYVKQYILIKGHNTNELLLRKGLLFKTGIKVQKNRGFCPGVRLGQSMLGNTFYKKKIGKKKLWHKGLMA